MKSKKSEEVIFFLAVRSCDSLTQCSYPLLQIELISTFFLWQLN